MKKLILSTFAIVLWSFGSRAEVATHGMVLLGKNVHYASHLPMFHPPHDYQGLWKVSLMEDGGKTLAAYQAAQAKGTTLFTLLPTPFDLAQLTPGDTLKADLYAGHFEKEGINLGPVAVKIEKTILFSQLDSGATPSQQYVVFGESGEYFAAHVVQGQPNVDALLSVTQPLYPPRPCHARYCPGGDSFPRPVKDENLPVIVPTLTVPDLETPQPGKVLGALIETTVQSVLYSETQDLQ